MGDVEDRKKAAVEFLRLAAAGKAKEGMRFFAPGCKHHNPFFPAGMDALTDAMVKAAQPYPDGIFNVERVLADGDLVAVHMRLGPKQGEGGFAQVHLFRFNGDKVAEYWDVTQQVPADSPNTDGMF